MRAYRPLLNVQLLRNPANKLSTILHSTVTECSLLQLGTKCSMMRYTVSSKMENIFLRCKHVSSVVFGAAAPNVAVLSPLLNQEY